MRKPCRRTRGFTLIELLVVITIIGILAGLAFPAISGAMNAARKAEAGAMISQLRTALSSYQTEYGVYPDALRDTGATPGDYKECTSGEESLYNALIAKKSGTSFPPDNVRGIVFMEFNAKVLRETVGATYKTPPADPSSAKAFVDPWSQPYFFRADADYDNKIASPISGDVNAGLIIWSPGIQKAGYINTATGGDKTKYICSWK